MTSRQAGLGTAPQTGSSVPDLLPIARAARCSTGSGIPLNAAACSASPSAAAICSVATPRSIARASAAIACVSAAPSSALDSRSRTRATFSLPRPTSSPMLNVLVNSASSCATSRTTALPSGAPPRLMHSNATYRGRANILKRRNRLNVRSGSVAGPPPRPESIPKRSGRRKTGCNASRWSRWFPQAPRCAGHRSAHAQIPADNRNDQPCPSGAAATCWSQPCPAPATVLEPPDLSFRERTAP